MRSMRRSRTALALAAVEPWNSGLGGIGFALVHPRRGRRGRTTVDFGPVAPAALDPSRFPLTGRIKRDLFAWPEVEGDANIHGPLSFAIPSAVAGYAAMHGALGPAAAGRRDGAGPGAGPARPAADWFTTLKVANAAAILRLYPESARIYLPGRPAAGARPTRARRAILPLGRLPDTLERLAHAGLRDFYEGDVAAALAADFAGAGRRADARRPRRLRGAPASCRTRSPGAAATLQTAGGLTAAPTLARVLPA